MVTVPSWAGPLARPKLVIAFIVALAASAHTYHSSIAQLDYISSKKTIEAIIWLHTEDIEQAFKAQHGSAANFDQPPAAERFVSQYLKSHFELRDKQGRLLDQKWVGLELKVHFLVAYFEVSADALTLTNNLLLDRVPDQLNTVQVKQDGQARHELQYSRAKASHQTLLRHAARKGASHQIGLLLIQSHHAE